MAKFCSRRGGGHDGLRLSNVSGGRPSMRTFVGGGQNGRGEMQNGRGGWRSWHGW